MSPFLITDLLFLADVAILVYPGGKSKSQVSHLSSSHCLPYDLFSVVSADGLVKRDVFRLPDTFAVITVDSEQTHTTSVIKKTLNPYWNEHFILSVFFCSCVPPVLN